MDCVLLGSGGMMPMPERLLTALVVRLGGQRYLFDAGEGAQLGLKRAHVGLRGLDLIALSHLHADHCLGLFGIMMLRAQLQDPAPLTILGPPGTQDLVLGAREQLKFFLNYPVTFVEWREGAAPVAFEDELVKISWRPLVHTRRCLGYRLDEHPRPGRFDADRADALGVPDGPARGQLQRGEPVRLASGEVVRAEQVLGPPRRGRRVAYVVDTRPCDTALELCAQADLAFVEGMHLPEHAAHAEAKGHLSVAEATALATRAEVRRAVLVHLSPRYDDAQRPLLEEAARSGGGDVEIGRDGAVYQVPLPDACE